MDKYERDQQIIRMRDQGKLIREICVDMGVCKNTVLKAIHGNGTPTPLPWYENRLGLSENALIEYVVHSYNDGKTMKALSAETGVRYSDISSLLKKKGSLLPENSSLTESIPLKKGQEGSLRAAWKGCPTPRSPKNSEYPHP